MSITVYIHFESIHCIRMISLNLVYFRLIVQVFAAHFWVYYLTKPLINTTIEYSRPKLQLRNIENLLYNKYFYTTMGYSHLSEGK